MASSIAQLNDDKSPSHVFSPHTQLGYAAQTSTLEIRLNSLASIPFRRSQSTVRSSGEFNRSAISASLRWWRSCSNDTASFMLASKEAM
jgi:hypothetical protein